MIFGSISANLTSSPWNMEKTSPLFFLGTCLPKSILKSTVSSLENTFQTNSHKLGGAISLVVILSLGCIKVSYKHVAIMSVLWFVLLRSQCSY